MMSQMIPAEDQYHSALLPLSPQYKVVGPKGNGDAVSSPTDTTPTQENPPF